MADPAPPPLPESELEAGGWEREEERTETLFEMPTIRIRGTTVQYDDSRSREAVRDVTGGAVDEQIRFFAGTRLGFHPPPPPGISPTMFLPTIRSEVRRTFGSELENRGLTDVERGRNERVRLPDRSRARLTKYTASDRLDGTGGERFAGRSLSYECWVGVWSSSGDVFVVSSGFPREALATQLAVDTDDAVLTRLPEEYRDEFFSLLRGVAADE